MITINLFFFKQQILVVSQERLLKNSRLKLDMNKKQIVMVNDKMRNSKSVHDTIRIYPDVVLLSALANLRFDTQWAQHHFFFFLYVECWCWLSTIRCPDNCLRTGTFPVEFSDPFRMGYITCGGQCKMKMQGSLIEKIINNFKMAIAEHYPKDRDPMYLYRSYARASSSASISNTQNNSEGKVGAQQIFEDIVNKLMLMKSFSFLSTTIMDHS